MNGITQGNGCVFSVFKNAWIAVGCWEQFVITPTSDVIKTRTAGDGPWQKNAQQSLGYSISLSGPVIRDTVDDTQWTQWDFLNAMLGFVNVQWRASFIDEQGVIKTMEGYCLINSTTFTAGATTPLSGDVSLLGNGVLKVYDGMVACDGVVTGANFTGLTTDANGNITVTPTFTGSAGKLKYRVDMNGPYLYQGLGTAVSLPGQTIDDHSIELVPVCNNGYEGIGLTVPFTVTHGLTCSITSTPNIAVNNKSASPGFSTTPASFRFKVDNGAWNIRVPSNNKIILSGTSPGSHTLYVQARCSNGAWGAVASGSFTTVAVPGSAVISCIAGAFNNPGTYFDLYVDSVRVLHSFGPTSFGVVVNTGQVIRAVLNAPRVGAAKVARLQTIDTDTSTTINDQSFNTAITIPFTFTANGDNFTINAYVT